MAFAPDDPPKELSQLASMASELSEVAQVGLVKMDGGQWGLKVWLRRSPVPALTRENPRFPIVYADGPMQIFHTGEGQTVRTGFEADHVIHVIGRTLTVLALTTLVIASAAFIFMSNLWEPWRILTLMASYFLAGCLVGLGVRPSVAWLIGLRSRKHRPRP
jgi:hypothetical protein